MKLILALIAVIFTTGESRGNILNHERIRGRGVIRETIKKGHK
jgi:hypothetical protein